MRRSQCEFLLETPIRLTNYIKTFTRKYSRKLYHKSFTSVFGTEHRISQLPDDIMNEPVFKPRKIRATVPQVHLTTSKVKILLSNTINLSRQRYAYMYSDDK